MRTIARFMDARNTAEGKFLSVLLSVLLVFSFLNVTMFTDFANAEDDAEQALVETPEDVDVPEAADEEPATDEVTEPEAEEPQEEAAPEQEPVAQEPEEEVTETPTVEEEPEADETEDRVTASGTNDGVVSSSVNTLDLYANEVEYELEPGKSVTIDNATRDTDKNWKISAGRISSSEAITSWSDSVNGVELSNAKNASVKVTASDDAEPGEYTIRHRTGWSYTYPFGYTYEYFYVTVSGVAKKTVSFDANGGSGAPSSAKYEVGTEMTLPEAGNMKRDGYEFLGWSTEKSAQSATYMSGSTYTVSEAVTFYAVWKQVVSLAFDANGAVSGSAPEGITGNVGEIVMLPEPAGLTRDGYQFMGWSPQLQCKHCVQG